MKKKRKFGDEVLYITINRDDLTRQTNSLITIFYKGIIKGITEMDNGTIYYYVDGQQYDVYRKRTVDSYLGGLQQIHSTFCFDNEDELIAKATEVLKSRR